MKKQLREESIRNFGALWHKILSSESNMKNKKQYPHLMALSSVESAIISMAYSNEDIILRDIIQCLGLPKSTLTSIINRLEEGGYLSRCISKRDRRSYGLCLTQKGIEAHDERARYEEQEFGSIVDRLTEEENSQLVSILNKITSP